MGFDIIEINLFFSTVPNPLSFTMKKVKFIDLVLVQSDEELIKSLEYITDGILGLTFEVGVSSSPKDPSSS